MLGASVCRHRTGGGAIYCTGHPTRTRPLASRDSLLRLVPYYIVGHSALADRHCSHSSGVSLSDFCTCMQPMRVYVLFFVLPCALCVAFACICPNVHILFVLHSPAPGCVLHMLAQPSVGSKIRLTTPSVSRRRHTVMKPPSSSPLSHPSVFLAKHIGR